MDERARKIVDILKKTYPNTKYYLTFSTPLQLLVATILSAQCRDNRVNSVTDELFKKYATAQDFTKLDENDISAITFFRNKAKYIREACQIVLDKFQGQVPQTMDELAQLPGVGRKTANAILINAFGKTVGIVVDTHVIRVSYRLGLTKHKDPVKIERDLMHALPQNDWNIYTWLMKDHGRAACPAPIPYCSRCVLFDLCPKQGVTKKL